jgi:peptidoglycan hydrolase-like protein with peptidoglycan-binding domain
MVGKVQVLGEKVVVLKKGDTGPLVASLSRALGWLGYPFGETDEFSPRMDGFVRAFQRDHGLGVDGKFGPKSDSMMGRAVSEGYGFDPMPPDQNMTRTELTGRERKLQRVLDLSQLSFGGRGIVYGPGVQRYRDGKWVVARGWGAAAEPSTYARSQGFQVPWTHGWVCSTCVGLVMGYWLNANDDYTWRTGRNQGFILRYPTAGQLYRGSTHVGYAEYVYPIIGPGFQAKPMGETLYSRLAELPHLMALEYPGHIVFLVKVDEQLQVIDPTTDAPARHGIYRLGADGFRNHKDGKTIYSAQRTTWKWLPPWHQDGQRWRLYGVCELNDDGTVPLVKGGRWHGNPTMPLVLDGLEHLVERIPELPDMKEAGLC